MTWHYGVIRKTKRIKEKTYHHYAIHEIYDENSWTEHPISMISDESLKDLRLVLSMALTDMERFPVYEIRHGKLIRRSQ